MAGPRTKILLAAAGLLALSACTSNPTVFPSWNQEAGAFIDEGNFGNPTMNNLLTQKCLSYIPKGKIIYEPRVVRSPVNAPKPYYRQATCSGYLNGKYAEVIFREYVASATEIPPTAESALTQ